MNELAKVILTGLREPLALESGSIPTPSQLNAAAAAVRAFVTSDEAVERGAAALVENNDMDLEWRDGEGLTNAVRVVIAALLGDPNA